MPVLAEFSERQYELAVNLELLAGVDRREFSVPSQVSENKLGYDIALVPAISAIWAILGLRRRPGGAKPGWGILSHASAPTFAASLFIQYKCPEELKRANAREADWRKALGVDPCLPYFRYELEDEQRSTLTELSDQVGSEAEVCYAAATFVSLRELNEVQAMQGVVAQSDFLPVAELAAALSASSGKRKRAHVWTYHWNPEPDGVLCSEPVQLRSYGGRDLFEVMAGRARESQRDLKSHLFALDQGVKTWANGQKAEDVGENWRGIGGDRDLGYLLQAPVEARVGLSIQQAVSRRGIGWHLALMYPRGND